MSLLSCCYSAVLMNSKNSKLNYGTHFHNKTIPAIKLGLTGCGGLETRCFPSGISLLMALSRFTFLITNSNWLKIVEWQS